MQSVLILPMRDWNGDTVQTIDDSKMFWSYLWGIEIEIRSKEYLLHPCFDLTYEGLKFQQKVRYELWTDCFDLTYEGLKFASPDSFLWCGSSFDLLILPMRDWNAFVRTWHFENFLCFDLTYEGLKCEYEGVEVHYTRTFWSYLWGIEIRP